MKWLALLVIVLSSFFVSISCSGGDDGVNIGDKCVAEVICESGVLYYCGADRIDEYATCDSVCSTFYPVGEWEFVGSCSDNQKTGWDYRECCNCRNVIDSRNYCASY